MIPSESKRPANEDGRRRPIDAASEGTTATYDQIAAIYYEKWRDRSAIRDSLNRFVDMLRVYHLSALPVVDVGCGPGFDAAFFRRCGLRTVGLDLSLAMMNAGRSEFAGPLVQADMRHLPLAAAGGLWVSASLLHVPRVQAPDVLRGFAHTLVPGGLLYLSLKAGEGAEWTTKSHGRPLSRYFVYWNPGELDQLLAATGFEVVDGWTSPVIEETSWLIRFARRALAGNSYTLELN